MEVENKERDKKRIKIEKITLGCIRTLLIIVVFLLLSTFYKYTFSHSFSFDNVYEDDENNSYSKKVEENIDKIRNLNGNSMYSKEDIDIIVKNLEDINEQFKKIGSIGSCYDCTYKEFSKKSRDFFEEKMRIEFHVTELYSIFKDKDEILSLDIVNFFLIEKNLYMDSQVNFETFFQQISLPPEPIYSVFEEIIRYKVGKFHLNYRSLMTITSRMYEEVNRYE